MPPADDIIAQMGGIIQTLNRQIEALEREKAEAREVIAQLTATIDHQNASVITLAREMDEAREAAQHFATWAMGENWALWETALRDYPWLKEKP